MACVAPDRAGGANVRSILRHIRLRRAGRAL